MKKNVAEKNQDRKMKMIDKVTPFIYGVVFFYKFQKLSNKNLSILCGWENQAAKLAKASKKSNRNKK